MIFVKKQSAVEIYLERYTRVNIPIGSIPGEDEHSSISTTKIDNQWSGRSNWNTFNSITIGANIYDNYDGSFILNQILKDPFSNKTIRYKMRFIPPSKIARNDTLYFQRNITLTIRNQSPIPDTFKLTHMPASLIGAIIYYNLYTCCPNHGTKLWEFHHTVTFDQTEFTLDGNRELRVNNVLPYIDEYNGDEKQNMTYDFKQQLDILFLYVQIANLTRFFKEKLINIYYSTNSTIIGQLPGIHDAWIQRNDHSRDNYNYFYQWAW
ncbi:hypothetical protein BDA99DRAFT_543358 [Phascolomyces articulosus]|uniref:Uncharacterized protein n=1 Tax=Phascolomyces articulosus TaxID=60185 RepID=A0AAD5K133_9FUNG|nr:hypothetical protein BDA99DRAFT_543358 [Phascolomyces articulosus]